MSGELEMQIEVRGIAHGQPRSYADTQSIYEVTVRSSQYARDADGRVDFRAPKVMELVTYSEMLEQIALGAVRAPAFKGTDPNRGWWESYTDYIHHVTSDGFEVHERPERSVTGTVRIRIVTPYTD